MSDGRIIIDTSVDNSGLEKGVNSLEGVAKTGLKVFTGAIIATGAAMAGISIKALDLASDLSEVQNVVDVTFGDNASKINDWAKAADTAFGISELQAKKFNGTMGAMLKSMGLTGDEVLGLSENITGLAGDFASFYNLDAQDAFDKIRSGISGETEPLKQLGINMSVANMEAYALTQGMTKQYKEMSQSEQTLLRYNYLMSVSADAQGDFTRTQDSFANQLRIAKLNVQDLGATLGNMLLPVAQETVKSFNGVTEKLKAAFDDPAVQESIKKLATAMGELITKVANFIADHLPQIIEGFTWIVDHGKEIIVVLGSMAIALKGIDVAITIMELVEAFKKFEIATKLAAAGQAILNAVMAINPIILIVTAIIALVAAVIYLWNTNEGFRTAVIEIFQSISDFFIMIWNGIMSFFTETIPAWIDSVIAWFEGIPAWFASLPEKIGYALGFVLGKIVQFGADCLTWIVNDLPGIILSIIDWFATLPDRINQAFLDILIKVIAWGLSMKDKASQAASDTVSGILSWFKELPGNMLDIGRNIITGIWDGIVGAKDWLFNKIGDFCGGIADGFMDALDINSPSRVMRDKVGKFIPQGINVGIEDEMPNLLGNVDTNMNDLVARMKGTVDYETARTTAGVVASKNEITGVDTIGDTPKGNNSGVCTAIFNLDGREIMTAAAPYQDILDEYNVGRV